MDQAKLPALCYTSALGALAEKFHSSPALLQRLNPGGYFDRFVADVKEGKDVRRGDILGYVGTTGNAPKNTPHLHFAIAKLDPDHR